MGSTSVLKCTKPFGNRSAKPTHRLRPFRVRARPESEVPFDLRAFRTEIDREWKVRVSGLVPQTSFDPGWKRCVSSLDPPMVLENDTYESPAFRKLHVEYGCIGNEFEVVHCVVFPCTNVPAPIFGADIVQRGSKTTFCITDVTPVDADGVLPLTYRRPIERLQKNLLRTSSFRPMPMWARDLFSSTCVTLSPRSEECARLWAKYTLAVLRLYLSTVAVTPRTVRVDSVREAHQRYADAQRQNDKTRGVLVRHFGDEFADAYIRNVLFDDPPTDPV